jgi:hypothetical protein
MVTAKIYTLTNPLNGEVFYIGVTKVKLYCRLSAHLSRSDHCKKKRPIIDSILAARLKPIITQIDEVDISEASYWEEFYFDLYTRRGIILAQNPRSKYYWGDNQSVKNTSKIV